MTGVNKRSQRIGNVKHDVGIILLHLTRLTELPPEFFHWMRWHIGESHGLRIEIGVGIVQRLADFAAISPLQSHTNLC